MMNDILIFYLLGILARQTGGRNLLIVLKVTVLGVAGSGSETVDTH